MGWFYIFMLVENKWKARNKGEAINEIERLDGGKLTDVLNGMTFCARGPPHFLHQEFSALGLMMMTTAKQPPQPSLSFDREIQIKLLLFEVPQEIL
uniref:Uncharacterized protein n=1 Tax=Angiostrongylus cantonensis TaxID=6313 RepID=A0A0K0DBA3_ANGCA